MLYNFFKKIIMILFKITGLFNKKNQTFLSRRLKQEFHELEKKETIWVHCSSVGEVNLSEPLVKKLMNSRDENILISVFTDTGYETAKRKYNDYEKIKIIFFPLDSFCIIRKILKLIELKLLIIVETEIWPNLIKLCSKKAKVIIVNARISDRSYPRYKQAKSLLKSTLKKVYMFYTQSEEDTKKLLSLGVKSDKIETLGNLKFAIEFETYTEKEKKLLKEKIHFQDRKIVVLGSTRESEEGKLLSEIREKEKYLFIVVPRHLDRLPVVEKTLLELGLSYHKYSEIESLTSPVDVILVDMMGVQRKFYAISDVAFVGGTLVNVGGHSLLEPLFYGKTPIYGKYIQNVKEISKELLTLGLGFIIDNESEFEQEIVFVLNKEDKKSEINELFEKNKDVLKLIVEKIDELI